MSRVRELFRRAEEVAKIDHPQKKRVSMEPFNEEGMDRFAAGGRRKEEQEREPTPEEQEGSGDGPHWDDLLRFGGDW